MADPVFEVISQAAHISVAFTAKSWANVVKAMKDGGEVTVVGPTQTLHLYIQKEEMKDGD